ncbi:MAG TPA: hypothetical protein ENN09_05690, partial [Planctomycetes bacterium]|nr:hypothetical protein [Planctomycetota bacterium]
MNTRILTASAVVFAAACCLFAAEKEVRVPVGKQAAVVLGHAGRGALVVSPAGTDVPCEEWASGDGVMV